MPHMPCMPHMPHMPRMPHMPHMPHTPHMHNMPHIPHMPHSLICSICLLSKMSTESVTLRFKISPRGSVSKHKFRSKSVNFHSTTLKYIPWTFTYMVLTLYWFQCSRVKIYWLTFKVTFWDWSSGWYLASSRPMNTQQAGPAVCSLVGTGSVWFTCGTEIGAVSWTSIYASASSDQKY